jgi:mediator of replication checkpoint protein 1
MTGSTGRLVGGIAVTGHGNRAKNGGGSLRSKGSLASVSTALPATSSSDRDKKSLKAESSVLARVTKRTFED